MTYLYITSLYISDPIDLFLIMLSILSVHGMCQKKEKTVTKIPIPDSSQVLKQSSS